MMLTKTLTDEQLERVKAVGFDYVKQPKEEVRACNLCGSKVWVQIAHHDRYFHQTSAYLCWECGHVFIAPLMTEEAYHRFYADYYRPLVSAYHGRTINAVTLQADQKGYSEDLVDFIRFQIRDGFSPKNILDVGGSTGIILKRLEKEFFSKPQLLCIDPAVNELGEAKKMGLETINGFIETHDFGGRKFDFIVLCQTIDHLRDIRLSLGKIHGLLSDNGLFFVDFVDFRKIYLKTGAVEGAIKIDHCYYLTDETTEAYLAACGFQIIRKGIAKDKVHVNYLCRKSRPKDLNLAELRAAALENYREIRGLLESFVNR